MVIALQTYADLHRNGCSLAYHCWNCQRWSNVDLAAIFAAGRSGQAYVGKRPRCVDCGKYGSPKIIITDRLASYDAALRTLEIKHFQRGGRWLNNRTDRPHWQIGGSLPPEQPPYPLIQRRVAN